MYQTQLMTTQLGHTGLEITRVGFGAWAIGGGGWEFGWGPQDDDESIAAIHRALELGDQLDRHRRRLRLRPLGADRRPRAAKGSPSARTCSPSARCSKARTGGSCTA